MTKRIFPNRRNKYRNKNTYVVVMPNGDILPFDSKNIAKLYFEQNCKDGGEFMTFQSRLEYDRFVVLKDFEKKGVIKDLETQVKFELIPTQPYEQKTVSPNGIISYKNKKMRGTSYYSDFAYFHGDEYVVEDTKSKITRSKPEYIIKKKLMLLKHGILIKEVFRECVGKL